MEAACWLDRCEVYGDWHLGEAEPLVEGSGRRVEWVAAGADLDYFDVAGAHVGDGVFAEAAADVLTPVEWRYRKKIDLAVARPGVASPGNEAADRAVREGSHGSVTACAGSVECRKLVTVVLVPVAVLVLEHLLAEERTGIAFEERPEGVDEKVHDRRIVVDLKWPDVHCGAFLLRERIQDRRVSGLAGSPMASALSAGAQGCVTVHGGIVAYEYTRRQPVSHRQDSAGLQDGRAHLRGPGRRARGTQNPEAILTAAQRTGGQVVYSCIPR